jgi:phosphoadenosine phosphosulfate reductase
VRDLIPTLEKAAAHKRLTFLCSFQKEESVILDALLALAPHVRIVTIDTGVLFDETLATWKAFEERFGVRIEVKDAADHTRPYTGPAEHCCSVKDAGQPPPKVAALERALAGSHAWITGIRREQGPSRAQTEHVEWDPKRTMWKYNPLAGWTEKDLWQRIHERGLPYHPLHDAGYASIGCAPCTQPGSGREGRWAGTEKTECGLHLAGPVPGS